MNIEPIEWKISASFDDGSHMVTFPAINKGILLLKKPEMADIESLIGLAVAARDAQWQAELAEQEPVGETLYRMKAGQQVLSAVVYEKFHTLPRGTKLYAHPPMQQEQDWYAQQREKIVAANAYDAKGTPAAQERAEPVAPAVGEREAFDAWVAQVKPRYWQAEAWQTEAWAMWQSINAALSATPPAPAQPTEPPANTTIKRDEWGALSPEAQALFRERVMARTLKAAQGAASIRDVPLFSQVQPSPEPSKPEQAEAPKVAFEDPRVQTVYGILCSEEVPPGDEHWEGFAARRIVDALATLPPASAAGELELLADIRKFVFSVAPHGGLLERIDAALATKPQAEQPAAPPAQTVQDDEPRCTCPTSGPDYCPRHAP